MDRLNPRTYLDLDETMAANSDSRVPSQRAVKAYVDGRVLHTSATLTYGSLASNATAEQTMSVPGATVSSTVSIGAPSNIDTGLTWCAYVSSADVVSVRIHNTTGGAINPVDAEWHVRVEVH